MLCFRTDKGGPAGRGFKLIVTAFNEGEWQELVEDVCVYRQAVYAGHILAD